MAHVGAAFRDASPRADSAFYSSISAAASFVLGTLAATACLAQF
jgi:hypothetical protein